MDGVTSIVVLWGKFTTVNLIPEFVRLWNHHLARMSPNKATPSSASAFMDDLLAGLRPVRPLPQNNTPSALANVASKQATQNRTIPHPSLPVSKRIGFSTSSKSSTEPFVSLPPSDPGNKASPPTKEPDDLLLFEGIEDWGDYESGEEELLGEPPPDPPQPVPLCHSFVECRVDKVPLEDAQWNPLKRRMERRVETLLLCDEWIDLPLDQGNPLNIVSFPGSPPINFNSTPCCFLGPSLDMYSSFFCLSSSAPRCDSKFSLTNPARRFPDLPMRAPHPFSSDQSTTPTDSRYLFYAFFKKETVLIDPRSNVKAGCDEPRIGIMDTEEEIWSPKYGLKGKSS
ncbi:hypothetical protein VP01_3478g1 [Puccinia sorghi]|uniref:Uncharacterized protein n=1 Tax=Puccinia sorghi TaxID=27349 RepID=A0A0L6UW22_9BASI|nr:hypothetical protein VP01_3478g1 [Puccinia sorghi]